MAALLDLCEDAVQQALRLGASEAEAFATATTETEAFLERNDVKLGKTHNKIGLGVRVFKNHALGFASINTFEPGRVADTVSAAIKMAANSPPDPHNMLPSPQKIARLPGLFDPAAEHFRAETALQAAVEMLRAAKDFDPRVTVDNGAFNAAIEQVAVANSHGVAAEDRASTFALFALGMAEENGDVSSFDVQFSGSHYFRELKPAETGQALARNVVASLGAKKCEAFTGTVLLTPEAVQEFLMEALVFACNSNNVQKGMSRFAGQLHQRVASDALTVLDDGTLVEGLGAFSFDREGVPHRRLPLIEKGVLTHLLYNTYTAHKDGLESSGNAAGTARASPTVGPSNFIVQAGSKTRDALQAEVVKGLLVTRFSGNVSPVSGDFSGVVKGGALIQNGQAMFPVKETLIAGNLFQALHNVSGVSLESKKILNYILPYIRLEQVSITGG